MEVWPYGDIEFIRKKVPTEYHNVVYQMQRARFEMKVFQRPNMPNPNTNSIVDISQCEDIANYFTTLKFRDPKSSLLTVNNELFIDAKAFLQMTQKDRETLIEEANNLKAITKDDKIELSPAASLVCQTYRLMFNKQREDGLQRLLKACKVKSREELTFGEIQFEKLEPDDVDRVIKLFRESGKSYNEKYSQVICRMANRFQVNNVLDFVAVAEYALCKIKEEITLQKHEKSSQQKVPSGMKKDDYYRERVVEKFCINKDAFQDTICNQFQGLLNNFSKHCPNHELGFKTLMAAANHYDKHSRKIPNFGSNETVSPEQYFEMARQMCSNPKENPTWTQDGSSVFWQFKRDDGVIASRYDNPYKGTKVIATFFYKKKKRDCSPLADAR